MRGRFRLATPIGLKKLYCVNSTLTVLSILRSIDNLA
jgi:hypothetical protein